MAQHSLRLGMAEEVWISQWKKICLYSYLINKDQREIVKGRTNMIKIPDHINLNEDKDKKEI